MFTNELKKGDRVVLHNGDKADIMDNQRGNTRLAKVYGICTDVGSVYSHNIMWKVNGDGSTTPIEYTEAQLKCKKLVTSFGF